MLHCGSNGTLPQIGPRHAKTLAGPENGRTASGLAIGIEGARPSC